MGEIRHVISIGAVQDKSSVHSKINGKKNGNV